MRVCAGMAVAAVGTGMSPAVDGSWDRSFGTPTKTTMMTAATIAPVMIMDGDMMVLPGRRGLTGLIQLPRACRWPARKSVFETDEAFCRQAPADGRARRVRHTGRSRRRRAGRRAGRCAAARLHRPQ